MDKKFVLLFILLVAGVVSPLDSMEHQMGQEAVPATNVSYFYSVTCSHCAKVLESGILDDVSGIEGVSVNKFEVTSPIAREKYLDYVNKFGIKNAGIPFAVIEQGGGVSYLMGDALIIEGLEGAVLNFRSHGHGTEPVERELGLWVVLGAALIDSINPCAFGVLLFLMAVLLSLGSAKRAFRSGLVYTGVIFVVYLAAGFGIMRFASGFLAMDVVRDVVGIVILIMAGIELKDFFWKDKGISLRIPSDAKPWLEKYARRGTLISLIILGALVALVELPCTGGIYLAILSLIADSGVKGIVYLVLYNVVFVLPLIFISYFVYSGVRIEVVNGWVQRNKRFMRLAAGIIMLGLGGRLLGWY